MQIKKGQGIDLDLLFIDSLRKLKENTLRKNIVVPLLKELGATIVIDMQGSKEYGIDVFFEWLDVFSHKRRFGIQLKIGDLVCRSRPDENKNILTICNQIKMGFSKEIIFHDSEHGKVNVTIDGYYIITSGKVNQPVINFIYQERKTFPYMGLS